MEPVVIAIPKVCAAAHQEQATTSHNKIVCLFTVWVKMHIKLELLVRVEVPIPLLSFNSCGFGTDESKGSKGEG